MSTLLQLAQDTGGECGVPGMQLGVGPATVVGVTGEQLRIVNWVIGAWKDIQLERDDWTFHNINLDRSDLPAASGANITTTASPYGVVASPEILFAEWDIRSLRFSTPASALGDEVAPDFFPYEQFRWIYRRGPIPQGTLPGAFTIDRDNTTILFDCTLGQLTRIRANYKSIIQTLAVDSDVPLAPAELHDVIKWRAIMKYAGFEEAGALYQHAQKESDRLFGALIRRCTPMFGWGDALA